MRNSSNKSCENKYSSSPEFGTIESKGRHLLKPVACNASSPIVLALTQRLCVYLHLNVVFFFCCVYKNQMFLINVHNYNSFVETHFKMQYQNEFN